MSKLISYQDATKELASMYIMAEANDWPTDNERPHIQTAGYLVGVLFDVAPTQLWQDVGEAVGQYIIDRLSTLPTDNAPASEATVH